MHAWGWIMHVYPVDRDGACFVTEWSAILYNILEFEQVRK